MRKPVAILLPTMWDGKQLEACRPAWEGRFEVRPLGPHDADVAWDFDVGAWVRELAREHPTLAGATSSSDYPGVVAAALLSQHLGLSGGDPRAVLSCGHKGEARAVAARAVPEVVPWWRMLEAGASAQAFHGLRFPCFVKPVRGSFSLLARQVEDAAALTSFLAHPALREHHVEYAALHRALARDLAHAGPDPGLFLAEGLLRGHQVTLEGWIDRAGVHVLGIVDSLMVPGTSAFARFETPSALPASVQARMAAVAERLVPALGLAQTCFNLELFWDARTDALALIEVNPRLAGQFGDLWQKTRGVNGYEIALALAAGETPPPLTTGPWAYAASVPLRTFEPLRVERAPSAESIAAVEAARPGTLVWWECATGDVLQGFDAAGERQGWRYAVINLGAREREDLARQAQVVVDALDVGLTPLAAGGATAR